MCLLRRDELVELGKRLPSRAIFCGISNQSKFIKNNPDLSEPVIYKSLHVKITMATALRLKNELIWIEY